MTDAGPREGSKAATFASGDIEGSSGVSALSIGLITERGGFLTFAILPSVEGPFELGRVPVDDAVIFSYSTLAGDWLAQGINI